MSHYALIYISSFINVLGWTISQTQALYVSRVFGVVNSLFCCVNNTLVI